MLIMMIIFFILLVNFIKCWEYRTDFTITNNKGTSIPSVEVLIVLNTKELISSGKMLGSCLDLKVKTAIDVEIQSYVESGCNENVTHVWINVSPLIDGITNFYIYYGDPVLGNHYQWDGKQIIMNEYNCNGHFTQFADDHRFPRGGTSNGVGGNVNHRHYFDSSFTTTSDQSGLMTYYPGMDVQSSSHTHEITFYTNYVDHYPSYYSLMFCEGTQGVLELVEGSIDIFDTTNVPTFYTSYDNLNDDERFPFYDSSNLRQPNTQVQHRHSYSDTCGGGVNQKSSAAGSLYSKSGHTHSYSGTTNYQTPTPSHSFVHFAKNSKTSGNIEVGSIIMAQQEIPPLGYVPFSSLMTGNRFPRGTNDNKFGTPGGSSTHTHSETISAGTASGSGTYIMTGSSNMVNLALVGHQHSKTVTSETGNHIPRYFEVYFAKKTIDNDVVVSLGGEHWECYGYLDDSVNACNTLGICESPQYCNCPTELTDDECETCTAIGVNLYCNKVLTASCTNTFGNIVCDCGTIDYFGNFCEDCDDSTFCNSNGDCSNINGNQNCSCFNDWRDVDCSICDVIHPKTIGTCLKYDCADNWYGEFCDQCSISHFCNDQASQCFDVANQPSCTCNTPSYYGTWCEFCDNNEFCSGNGDCLNNGNQNCTCFDDWKGFNCSLCEVVHVQTPSTCRENECEQYWNGEYCNDCSASFFCNEQSLTCVDNAGNPDCTPCNQYFSGQLCEYCDNIFHCNGVGISCQNLNSEVLCSCESTYSGSDCSNCSIGNFCNSAADSCIFDGNYQNCSCLEGFTGELCEYCDVNIFCDPKKSSNCVNSEGIVTCVCDLNQGFYGSSCEIPFVCFGYPSNDSLTCSSHGECVFHDTCECSELFTNETCWMCEDGYYLFENERCITDCTEEDGYFNDGIQCSQCNEHCIQCDSEELCTLCSNTYTLTSNGQCEIIENQVIPIVVSTLSAGFIVLIVLGILVVFVIIIIFSIISFYSSIRIAKRKREKMKENLLKVPLQKVDDAITQRCLIRKDVNINEKIFVLIKNLEVPVFKYEQITLEYYVGAGASGNIFKGMVNEEVIAFKSFPGEVNPTEFEREIKIFVSCKHENILGFKGVCIEEKHFGLILDFAEYGDLKFFLNKNSNLNRKERCRLLLEIAQAINYIHEKGFIHRDIKPNNVLVDKNIRSRLTDFGISIEKSNEIKSIKVGTYKYMSPELFSSEDYNESTDCFSFAIVTFEVLANNFSPYGTSDGQSIALKVFQDPSYRPELSSFNVEDSFKTLLQSMMDSTPKNRPKFTEICASYKTFWKRQKEPLLIYLRKSNEKDSDAEDFLMMSRKYEELEDIIKEKWNRDFVEIRRKKGGIVIDPDFPLEIEKLRDGDMLIVSFIEDMLGKVEENSELELEEVVIEKKRIFNEHPSENEIPKGRLLKKAPPVPLKRSKKKAPPIPSTKENKLRLLKKAPPIPPIPSTKENKMRLLKKAPPIPENRKI